MAFSYHCKFWFYRNISGGSQCGLLHCIQSQTMCLWGFQQWHPLHSRHCWRWGESDTLGLFVLFQLLASPLHLVGSQWTLGRTPPDEGGLLRLLQDTMMLSQSHSWHWTPGRGQKAAWATLSLEESSTAYWLPCQWPKQEIAEEVLYLAQCPLPQQQTLHSLRLLSWAFCLQVQSLWQLQPTWRATMYWDLQVHLVRHPYTKLWKFLRMRYSWWL